MEQVQEIAQWIQAHWAEIGSAVLGIIVVGNTIAGITETKKDDAFWKKAGDIVGKIFGREIPK